MNCENPMCSHADKSSPATRWRQQQDFILTTFLTTSTVFFIGYMETWQYYQIVNATNNLMTKG